MDLQPKLNTDGLPSFDLHAELADDPNNFDNRSAFSRLLAFSQDAPELDRKEEIALSKRAHLDPASKDRLAHAFLPVVVDMAFQMTDNNLYHEDLIASGLEAVAKCLNSKRIRSNAIKEADILKPCSKAMEAELNRLNRVVSVPAHVLAEGEAALEYCASVQDDFRRGTLKTEVISDYEVGIQLGIYEHEVAEAPEVLSPELEETLRLAEIVKTLRGHLEQRRRYIFLERDENSKPEGRFPDCSDFRPVSPTAASRKLGISMDDIIRLLELPRRDLIHLEFVKKPKLRTDIEEVRERLFSEFHYCPISTEHAASEALDINEPFSSVHLYQGGNVELDESHAQAVFEGQSLSSVLDMDMYERKKELLPTALNSLTDREREVLELLFDLEGDGEKRTLVAVGLEIGVGKERVLQIRNKALRKIRQVYRSHAIRLKTRRILGIIKD